MYFVWVVVSGYVSFLFNQTTLGPADFAGNFYLIRIFNCKTIYFFNSELIYAMCDFSMMADLNDTVRSMSH